MVAIAKPEMERVPRRRVRMCKHCLSRPTSYYAPGNGRLKSDRTHDLCFVCFAWLVDWANRRRG